MLELSISILNNNQEHNLLSDCQKYNNKSLSYCLDYQKNKFELKVCPNRIFYDKYSMMKLWIIILFGVISMFSLTGILYYRERNLADLQCLIQKSKAKPLLASAKFRWKIIFPILGALIIISVVFIYIVKKQGIQSEISTSN